MTGFVEAAIQALSAFGAQSQESRLLRMAFPQEDGPSHAAMLVNKVHMREELSRDYCIDVEVLSDDAHIALKSMMARMVTISLVREDGSLRHMNGYVNAFRFIRTDGGFAYYRMILKPWLAFARLRKDNVSFQNRSVLELTEATFSRYRQHDWRTAMSVNYGDKKLTVANQHNETDYNHLHRRWEDAGLYYWYEHREDGHTLVLSDSSPQAEPIDSAHVGGTDGAIQFRAHGGSDEGDGIHEWEAARELGSGKVSLASFNYKSPRPQVANGSSMNKQGDAADDYELYENTGAYGYADLDEGDALAIRRMEGYDSETQVFNASSNDRTAQAGRCFKLDGHFSAEERRPEPSQAAKPSIAGREYLILSVEHNASNNYPAGRDAKPEYTNSFICIRSDIPWRPGRRHNSEPCANPGVQTAIVVGPPGEDIYTDDLGRVKLQFHWDREGEYDQASSPWVRVMMPMAGTNLGQMCLPRIGQEVVVQFLDGNIDRPIVVGIVYNRLNMPPWNLPGQKALSGLRSRELKNGNAGSSNHLILDDTNGAMQVQLKSDHQCSQLSLGSITRIETAAGRMDARGEGWELATNAWGVARAGRGMLLTTEARPNATSHATSLHETSQRLESALERQRKLTESAQKYGAQEGQLEPVASALESQNKSIAGSGASEKGGSEFRKPHLVLASPAGIEATTAQSTHMASDEHTAFTTGRTLSMVAGDSLLASVGETFRLFVKKAGMKLVAASGKVSIRAKDDEFEAIAKKVVSLISESDWVDIRGRKGIRLHGASSMIEIGEKVQFFTSEPTLFHGNLETLSPRNRPQPEEEKEIEKPGTGELHVTLQRHTDGAPLAEVPFALFKDEVKIKDGLTDAHGRIVVPHQDGTPEYKVVLPNGDDFLLKVAAKFDDPKGSDANEQTLSNLGFRAMDDTTKGRQHD